MSAESRKGKSQFKDHFLVLQVHPQADGAMVDAAYWHLAKRYNETALTDPRYKRKIEELNEAYAVVGSPDRRDAYMQLRALVLGEDALPTPPPQQPEKPPLSVMERQKPRARTTQRAAEPETRQFPTPAALRSGLAATVVLGLTAATFLAGGSFMEVALLLGIGLLIAAAPLGPALLGLRPRLRAPGLSMPSLSLPRRPRDFEDDENDEPPAKVIPIDTARLQESIRSSREHLREDAPAKHAQPDGGNVPEFAKLHRKQGDKSVDHAASARAAEEEPSIFDERD